VLRLRRIGKRIVFELEGGLFLVLHLMIAGRLRWLAKDKKPPGRISLAVLEFEDASLLLTEAGTKRRASINLVQGEAALAAIDPGGLEVLGARLEEFSERLRQDNRTVKRALTDPHLFSGIGNAYSDEILHRAKLSPFAQTSSLSQEELKRLFDATRSTLLDWTERLRKAAGADLPRKSRRSTRRWPCTGATASPARCAARRCSASCTRRTRPTTARAARPAARSSPTAPCRGCSRRAGRARSTSWSSPPYFTTSLRRSRRMTPRREGKCSKELVE